MSSVPQKHCITCAETKPSTEFCINRSTVDGLNRECKKCACARARAWRQRNPDRDRQIQKATREKRKAKGIKHIAPVEGTKLCNACKQEKHVTEFYRATRNPDGLDRLCATCARDQWRGYHKAKLEHHRAMRRAWAKRNHEKVLGHRAQYRKKNHEVLRTKRKMYDLANPDKRRERVMRRNARKKAAQIGTVDYQRIWDRDKGICWICGTKVDRRNCHFDHVIPLAKGGAHSEENIAVSHSWCNQHKNSRIIKYEQSELF